MKRSGPLSQLRALAAMGMSEDAFVMAFLEALHGVIPSSRNLFDWTNSSGELVRYYFEGPVDHSINEHYFEAFHNKLEAEAMPMFRDAVMGRAVIHSAKELDRPEFFRSALYNEIWRPQRLHTRIEAVVRNVRQQPLGSLVLYRGPGERKFTQEDEVLLERIVPYVARGLEGAARDEQSSTEYVGHSGRRAAIILGKDGVLERLSPDALKLLLMSHGGITPDAASRSPSRHDFATLTAVWHLTQSSQGIDGQDVKLTVENASGRFLYQACALRPLDRDASPSLHVTLQHFEPQLVAIRRALDSLSLTAAQKEICVHLRRGCSHAEIANIVGTRESTVVDHVKKIYSRLDVHSVHELSSLLHRLIIQQSS